MKERLKMLPISDLGKKSLSLLFFLPLAAILANAAVGSSNYMFLLVFAGIIFFTVLTHFEAALVLIGITSYFLSYAIWKLNLPSPMINLGYVLIIMVLIREYFFTAHLLPVRTPINRILMFIIAFAFLSIAGGNSGIYASFKGLMRHVGFPFLFLLILVAEPDEKLMKKLVIGILIVAFIQIPASACQWLWYTFINVKPSGMRADYSGGLLGFSCGGYNSIFMAMTFCLMLGIIIVRGFRWYWALGAALLVLPIFLASARAGIMMFALATVFMLLVAPLPRHGPFFQRLLIAVALFAIIVGATLGLGGEGFRAIFNPDYVYNYSINQADSGMGRLQAFDIIAKSLRSPQEKLIGRGPGMLTPTSISKNPDSLIAQNPFLFDEVTGFAYTTIELGYAGLVLFLLLYVQVYRFTRRLLKTIDDPFWESIALGFCGSIFIYVISTVYVDSWIFYPLPFTFWAIAAALYRVGVIRGVLSV
jgi:hypothetical protein